MSKVSRVLFALSDENLVFTLLSTGIIYSLFLWPLLNSILCITLAAYWLLFCKKVIKPGRNTLLLVLIFASLYLPYLTGMFYTGNVHEGVFRLTEHLAFLLFPFVFGCSKYLHLNRVRLLLTHFILSCFVASAAGFLLGLLTPDHIVLPLALRYGNRYIFGDTYPYIIAISCLLSLIVICEGVYNHRILPKRLAVFIFVFLSFYLLFLNVRLIAAIWLCFMIYFIFKKIPSATHRILIISSILLLAVGTLQIPVLKSKWDELRNYREQVIPLDRDASLGKSWGGMSIRMALWDCGKDLIVRHPLLGVGTGDVQDSLQQVYESRKFYFASRYNVYNLHNQYLQTLAAFGLFGLFTLLASMLAPLIFLKSDKLSTIRLLFLLIFFLICFTEVILDTNKGIIWYSFFNSIFAFGASDSEA